MICLLESSQHTSEMSLQELAEFEQINSEHPLSEEDIARQALEAGGNANNSER